MLEKYASDLPIFLERAAEEARLLGHGQVGLDHLLLAFAFDFENYPAKFLVSRGVTYHILRRQVERRFGRGSSDNPAPAPSVELNQFLQLVPTRLKWPKDSLIPTKVLFDFLTIEPAEITALLEAARHNIDTAREDLLESNRHIRIAAEPLVNCHIPMACGDFTEAANFALLFARVEAATFVHERPRVDTESLLVGLIAEQSGEAGKLLRKMGVTIRQVRGEPFNQSARELGRNALDRVTFTGTARLVLAVARTFSQRHRQPFVGTEHLLWALISSGRCQARDLLATLIDDVAVLKVHLEKSYARSICEGTPGERELNFRLFEAFRQGSESSEQTYAAIGESLVSNEYGFQLSQLDAASVDVMLWAFREYAKLRFVSFDIKHVLLGILAHGSSPAAHTLKIWNVSMKSARRTVQELESLGAVCEPGKKVPSDVVALLAEALTLARHCGADQVSPNHMLWALARSVDPQAMVLLDRLGLDPVVLCDHAACLCQDLSRLNMPMPMLTYSDFYTALPDESKIFEVLCEPNVLTAMRIAFDEARTYQLTKAGGEFLFLGLLCSAGKVSKVLKGLGIDSDTTRGAIREMLNSPDWQLIYEPERKGTAESSKAESAEEHEGPFFKYPKIHELIVQGDNRHLLPVSILQPNGFLPFLRLVEQRTVDEKLEPVIVYWGAQQVFRMLPPARNYGTLVRESTFVGYFSGEQKSRPDEWSFLIESPRLSLVVYGQQKLNAPNSANYRCFGSTDPAVVRESFNALMSVWQTIDLQQSNRVEDYRIALGPGDTSPENMLMLRAMWPVIQESPQMLADMQNVDRSCTIRSPVDFEPTIESAFGRALELSLKAQQVHVATEHLLTGLIETDNSRLMALLSLINISPQAILEKLRSC